MILSDVLTCTVPPLRVELGGGGGGGGEGTGNLGGVRVGLGHRFAAAWVRVRAAFGDG